MTGITTTLEKTNTKRRYKRKAKEVFTDTNKKIKNMKEVLHK